ncbi:AI-2E family transporter [Thiofaba sp. EF100]|uniref:AI-2E family transporter n=1 Tax=Thiofaba sp. EF100 TaxID=3121274 RepID=UPI0032221192
MPSLPTTLPPSTTAPTWMHWLAFALAVAAVFFAVKQHLLPALLAGLLMHQLVHAIAKRLISPTFSSHLARVVAILLVSAVVLTLLTLGALALLKLMHGTGQEGVEGLMKQMARILDDTKAALPAWAEPWLPPDTEALKQHAVDWLRSHAAEVGSAGGALGYGLVHILIGLIIGAMISLHTEATDPQALRPLARALLQEVSAFSLAFRRIITAQAWITTVNTTLTGLYLLVALPLAGVHLPLVKTMVLVTFVMGFIPIVGNLVSNTVITIISLSHSVMVAASSLAFLVIVHKVEYFLNARIVGGHIRARAWEILIAMLAMERIAGIPGLVISPILYAYIKDGLKKRGWV